MQKTLGRPLLPGSKHLLHPLLPNFENFEVSGHCSWHSGSQFQTIFSARACGDGTKVTERAQNADFRRKPQIFADSPLLLEIQAFGGRMKPQKTADFRRKQQETADWAPSP